MEWVIFFIIIFTLLALDLGIFNNKDAVISPKTSIIQSAFYITLGLTFGIYIWFGHGSQAGKEYLTGFLIEKTLSLDNIFLISVIFSYFHIPTKYQHRVLFWGILGVIILRGILIYLGAELIHRFEWVMYIFGLILILTGLKMLFIRSNEVDLSKNFMLNFIKKYLPITNQLHDNKFLITKENKLYFTPLFLALIVIEMCDLVFAIDSVPAVFSITTNTFIVYTSNIFAILGLRSIFFAINHVIGKFRYLKYSLALILMFIGSKVYIVEFFSIEKFPASLSLGITVALISFGIIFSLVKKEKRES